MKKYEVIDYEVRADPLAEPVASSTERLQKISNNSTTQPTCIVFGKQCHVEQLFLAFTRGWNRFGSD